MFPVHIVHYITIKMKESTCEEPPEEHSAMGKFAPTLQFVSVPTPGALELHPTLTITQAVIESGLSLEHTF
jgi:hypothetical protein